MLCFRVSLNESIHEFYIFLRIKNMKLGNKENVQPIASVCPKNTGEKWLSTLRKNYLFRVYWWFFYIFQNLSVEMGAQAERISSAELLFYLKRQERPTVYK